MKKRVFKGVINGQEFDNVNDYNAYMSTLLNEGKDVNASSSTQIKEVCDECGEIECTCSYPAGGEVAENKVNMLPGFNPMYEGNPLESLVTNDPEMDRRNLEKIHQYHKDELNNIFREIRKMSLSELKSYLKKLDVVLDELAEARSTINNRTNDTTNRIEALEHAVRERIKNYEKVLDYDKRCDPVLSEYENLYGQLHLFTTDLLDEISDLSKSEQDPRLLVAPSGLRNLLRALYPKK